MVTRPKISFDEERITKVIKEVFAKEFKKQEVIIMKFIISLYVTDSLSESQDKILEMENRSRRNKIRVDGLTEEKGETWEDCENKVFGNVKTDKLKIEDVTIEPALRVKPYQNNQNNKDKPAPRRIVCKLFNHLHTIFIRI